IVDRVDDSAEEGDVIPVFGWDRALAGDEIVGGIHREQIGLGDRIARILHVGAVADNDEIEARYDVDELAVVAVGAEEVVRKSVPTREPPLVAVAAVGARRGSHRIANPITGDDLLVTPAAFA